MIALIGESYTQRMPGDEGIPQLKVEVASDSYEATEELARFNQYVIECALGGVEVGRIAVEDIEPIIFGLKVRNLEQEQARNLFTIIDREHEFLEKRTETLVKQSLRGVIDSGSLQDQIALISSELFSEIDLYDKNGYSANFNEADGTVVASISEVAERFKDKTDPIRVAADAFDATHFTQGYALQSLTGHRSFGNGGYLVGKNRGFILGSMTANNEFTPVIDVSRPGE